MYTTLFIISLVAFAYLMYVLIKPELMELWEEKPNSFGLSRVATEEDKVKNFSDV